MRALFPRLPGCTLSGDIAVPEHEQVVRFYAGVLTTGERPLWRDDLMNNLGMPIIGLGVRSAELDHLPLQWMPHIQVASVAAGVERALELGGQELMHGKSEAGESLWAVLLDCDGAAFGLIPVVSASAGLPELTHDPAAPVGRIAGLSLTVPDAQAARDFYLRVVGWTSRPTAGPDGKPGAAGHDMLAPDGLPAARICSALGEGAALPPAWMLHLPVGDLDESLRRVEAGGGRIVRVVGKSSPVERRALIQDPVGVAVVLVPG